MLPILQTELLREEISLPALGGGARGPQARGAPHSAQNLPTPSCAPHSLQNLPPVRFAPTYKCVVGKSPRVYANKRDQAPSFTDRVLYRSLGHCALVCPDTRACRPPKWPHYRQTANTSIRSNGRSWN